MNITSEIIKLYGEKAYYEYLKNFIELSKSLSGQVYIQYIHIGEEAIPEKICIEFEPLTVFRDQINLENAIRESNKNGN